MDNHKLREDRRAINDAALMRLVTAVIAETHDEWAVATGATSPKAP